MMAKHVRWRLVYRHGGITKLTLVGPAAVMADDYWGVAASIDENKDLIVVIKVSLNRVQANGIESLL